IHAFTKALAANLLERGIRVNAVAPRPVWTPLNPADRELDKVAKFGQDSDMRRPAQPEEISPAYVFLASPVLASYGNGVVLRVLRGPRGYVRRADPWSAVSADGRNRPMPAEHGSAATGSGSPLEQFEVGGGNLAVLDVHLAVAIAVDEVVGRAARG